MNRVLGVHSGGVDQGECSLGLEEEGIVRNTSGIVRAEAEENAVVVQENEMLKRELAQANENAVVKDNQLSALTEQLQALTDASQTDMNPMSTEKLALKASA